jgi:hypothetical protein
MTSAVKDVQQPADAQSDMKDLAPVRCFSDMGNFPLSAERKEIVEGSVDATHGLYDVRPSAGYGSGDGGSGGGKGNDAAAKRGNFNSKAVDDDVPIVLPTVEEARAKVADAFSRNARVGENPFGRTRSTPLGTIEWDRVDPLALSKADRRQAEDLKYSRPHISAAQMDLIKQKWQARQVKRVSNAARLYGARESQKELWEFLAVHEKEKQQREERQHPSQNAASTSSSAASGARSQGARSAQAGGNWGSKDQNGKGHASVEGGVDFSAEANGARGVPGASTADSKSDTIKQVAPLPKTSSKTTLKTISKAFKNMMGSQKPGKMESLIQRMSKTHAPTSYMDTV